MTLAATFIAALRGSAGPQGLSTRSGSGAPTSGTAGNNGDTYLDVTGATQYEARAGGVWPSSGASLKGPVGATGPAGTSVPAIGSLGYRTLPPVSSGGTIALSSTYVNLGLSSGDVSQAYLLQGAGYLQVATIVFAPSGTASAALRLVNIANPSIVYADVSISSTSSVTTAQYTAAGQGGSVDAGVAVNWQVSGSGSANITVTSSWLMTTTVACGAKSMPPAFTPAGATLAPAGLVMTAAGGQIVSYGAVPTTGYLSAFFAQNGTNSSATFSLVNSSTLLAVYTTATVASGSSLQLTNMDQSVCPFVPGQLYYWRASGSGTGPTAVMYKVAF